MSRCHIYTYRYVYTDANDNGYMNVFVVLEKCCYAAQWTCHYVCFFALLPPFTIWNSMKNPIRLNVATNVHNFTMSFLLRNTKAHAKLKSVHPLITLQFLYLCMCYRYLGNEWKSPIPLMVWVFRCLFSIPFYCIFTLNIYCCSWHRDRMCESLCLVLVSKRRIHINTFAND